MKMCSIKYLHHMGQGIQEPAKQNLRETAFKKFEVIYHITSNFLKADFHKFYLVRSWIPWPIHILCLSLVKVRLKSHAQNISHFLNLDLVDFEQVFFHWVYQFLYFQPGETAIMNASVTTSQLQWVRCGICKTPHSPKR